VVEISLAIAALVVTGAMWSMARTQAQLRAHIAQMHELHAQALRAAQAKSLQELTLAEQILRQQPPSAEPTVSDYERWAAAQVNAEAPAPMALGGIHENPRDLAGMPMMPGGMGVEP
jgi:hypothetical protein